MANICNFGMQVKGSHNDIENFYNAMTQNGNIYMGRGADAQIIYDDKEGRAFIDGWCKWSIQSAMVDNAISMRNNPEQWYWGEGVDVTQFEFITLFEACQRWNLDMEVYSEECGCCFQEHYVVVNGDLICDERVDYYEYCIDDYENKEDAEADLGIIITDEEWNSGDCFISRGGFGDWIFEI